MNLLDVTVVPLLVAIDEQGVVVSHQASPRFVSKWLDQGVDVERVEDPEASESPFRQARQDFIWGGPEKLDAAIASYEKMLADDFADNAEANFEVAVCYRHRFERDDRPEDFQNAIDHWRKALALNPNQYIYRRRIEQYGARLGKPYPFYDWVSTARKEIIARGEKPVELKVEISGAEIASPIRGFQADSTTVDWDAANKINEDQENLVQARAVAVKLPRSKATRVHVLVTPGDNAKWNNEAGPTSFVLQQSTGVTFSKNSFQAALPDKAESNETRRFEFEVLIDDDQSDPVQVRGAVLINVCISDSGVCTYLRKPFEVTVQPAGK